ncbi:ribonuclease 3-like protein 2 [Brassica rapa]|uniref:ribonuclease 3-like protein 2 n=1 Tax=Brassica campestris TaxID=3711 RepID=UPI0004F18732|nr:ribonuclease 3-like protein 2 [Brassica rapa]
MDRFFSPDFNSPTITPSNLSNSFPSVNSQAITRPPISPEKMESLQAVEKIVNYSFANKSLLEEALTHTSCVDFPSYERLEFVGDSAVGLALTNYLYLTYPNAEPHELSQLRAANVSTEKFARVALKHGLYRFLRRNAPSLDEKVTEFSEAVCKEDDSVYYGGLVKAPKVLADLLESVAGAVYIDVNFDLQRFWVIFRGLLEPIFTLDDLQQQPQPISMLFQLCHKHNKRLAIRYLKEGKRIIAGVYLDDQLFASGSAENKDTAKLLAAKEALGKFSECTPIAMVIDEGSVEVEVEDAKRKLYEICSKKKWPKPIYSVEEERGSANEKRFVCSARIKIPSEESPLYMKGDEESKKKKAENSSAYHMIIALRKSNYL